MLCTIRFRFPYTVRAQKLSDQYVFTILLTFLTLAHGIKLSFHKRFRAAQCLVLEHWGIIFALYYQVMQETRQLSKYVLVSKFLR